MISCMRQSEDGIDRWMLPDGSSTIKHHIFYKNQKDFILNNDMLFTLASKFYYAGVAQSFSSKT